MDMKEKMSTTPMTPVPTPSAAIDSAAQETGPPSAEETEPGMKDIEILEQQDEDDEPVAVDVSSQANANDTAGEDINSSREPKLGPARDYGRCPKRLTVRPLMPVSRPHGLPPK